MGISLGWVVFFAAGVTGAPPAERNAGQISYTVRMVEADGVGWREAVFTRLKPVTRQGAATVWTLPKNAAKSLVQQITKNPSGTVVQAPRVTAVPGVPATIQVRANRKFVTQVAWNGDEIAANGSPEDVRVGWHTTMVGRKLDQGILVKMVIEDTEIRGIHRVKVVPPYEPKAIKGGTPVSGLFRGEGNAAGTYAIALARSPFNVRGTPKTRTEDAGCCNKAGTADSPALVCGGVFDDRVPLELPEIGNQEVLGEWLIPKGECLLVSFGPHTVADKDGKAVVRERLAFVEADEKTDVMVNSAAPFFFIPAPQPYVIAPHPAPAAHAPISAPAPMPGPDFVTERGPVLAPVAPVAPGTKLPTPGLPSRSFPQGVHVDGSKAKLPPLPDDELDDESAESESAEPLPSPQTRKPRKPKPEPASDTGTTKATFTQPRSSTVLLPSVFLPGASVGFQFLLPVKPLSLRLPFNQRLEIEIFGRVVPDTQTSDSGK